MHQVHSWSTGWYTGTPPRVTRSHTLVHYCEQSNGVSQGVLKFKREPSVSQPVARPCPPGDSGCRDRRSTSRSEDRRGSTHVNMSVIHSKQAEMYVACAVRDSHQTKLLFDRVTDKAIEVTCCQPAVVIPACIRWTPRRSRCRRGSSRRCTRNLLRGSATATHK